MSALISIRPEHLLVRGSIFKISMVRSEPYSLNSFRSVSLILMSRPPTRLPVRQIKESDPDDGYQPLWVQGLLFVAAST